MQWFYLSWLKCMCYLESERMVHALYYAVQWSFSHWKVFPFSIDKPFPFPFNWQAFLFLINKPFSSQSTSKPFLFQLTKSSHFPSTKTFSFPLAVFPFSFNKVSLPFQRTSLPHLWWTSISLFDWQVFPIQNWHVFPFHWQIFPFWMTTFSLLDWQRDRLSFPFQRKSCPLFLSSNLPFRRISKSEPYLLDQQVGFSLSIHQIFSSNQIFPFKGQVTMFFSLYLHYFSFSCKLCAKSLLQLYEKHCGIALAEHDGESSKASHETDQR